MLETFFEIFDDACFILQGQEDQKDKDVPEVWDTRVETLSTMIKQIQNQYTFTSVHDRFVKNLYQAKKTPNDRASSYSVLQEAIGNFAE